MEVVSGIHLIEGLIAHCYLIVDKDLTLIDTGLPRNTKKIIQYITDELHRTPSDLKTIVLTHSHYDHTGNSEALRTLTGATIAAHTDDAEIIAGSKMHLMPKSGLSILIGFLSSVVRTKPFQVDLNINDGGNIAGLTVIHLPGHTPGSIGLYDSKRKVLFIGDTLRYKDGIVRGPPKSVTWDIVQAYHSIEKLGTLDFSVMLSGHREPLLTDASSKVRQFITNINKKKTTR